MTVIRRCRVCDAGWLCVSHEHNMCARCRNNVALAPRRGTSDVTCGETGEYCEPLCAQTTDDSVTVPDEAGYGR